MNAEKYAILTEKVLSEKNCAFSNNFKLIKSLFDNSKISKDKKLISIRLIVLDNLYSTNLNKRYNGIEQIAAAINRFGTDLKLKKIAICFYKNPTDKNLKSFRKLLFNDYGYKKNGADFGHAISLISKYLYFLTKAKFPIYDSFALKYCKIFYPKIHKGNRISKTTIDYSDFLSRQSRLFLRLTNCYRQILTDKKMTIKKLDHLFWYVGKLKKKSTSIIINQEEIKKLKNYGIKLKNVFRKNNLNKIAKHKIFTPEKNRLIKWCSIIALGKTNTQSNGNGL